LSGWSNQSESSKARRKVLRRIEHGAAEIPDPLARLRYLRQRTAAMPNWWWLRHKREIPWRAIVKVGGAAAVLAASILLWRAG